MAIEQAGRENMLNEENPKSDYKEAILNLKLYEMSIYRRPDEVQLNKREWS